MYSDRDAERLAGSLGSETAAELMPRLKALQDEFYASDAVHRALDLKEMGDAAAARFRGLHPDLSDEAVEALAWCYTWDYK